VVALVAALVIADTGGGIVRIAGVRLALRSPDRLLVLGLAILAARVIWARHVGPFGRPWRALATWLGLSDDVRQAPCAPLPDWREILVATAALTAAVALILHRQVANLRAVPDLGDPLFSMWRMAWVPHQLAANPAHLFDANIFFPERATLTYSDSIILPALTAAPLLAVGVSVSIAYTLLFLSSFVQTGIATYLLARAWAMGPIASWTAALMFAVYPFRLDHYSHLEIQMAQWMPIVLLTVHRLLATGRARFALYLSLALGAQWYSCMYYGVFLTVYAGVFASVLAVAWRVGPKRLGLAAAGLVAGVVLAGPLAAAYGTSQQARGIRSIDAVEFYSARPVDYLIPTPRSAVYGSVWKGPRTPERDLFPGIAPLLLAGVAAVPPLSATRLALIASGLVAFDGSLGVNGHWWRAAYDHVGPIRSLRVPARFAMLVGLTLALLAGIAVDRLRRHVPGRRGGIVLCAGLTLVLFVEAWPILKLKPVWNDPPPVYAGLGPGSGAVLFEYPLWSKPELLGRNLPYMYFSTWHWTPMVNGYSGFAPRSYAELAVRTAGFPGGNTVDYLQGRGVTHVTVNCGLMSLRPCAATMGRLDADSRFRLLRDERWNGAPVRLYSLAR
jgi:hypothetical protein